MASTKVYWFWLLLIGCAFLLILYTKLPFYSHIYQYHSILPSVNYHYAINLHNMTHVSSAINLSLAPLCNPTKLGRIFLSEDLTSFQMHPEVLTRFAKPQAGGFWSPSTCRSHQRIAIIFPYRNRPENVQLAIPHLHYVLQSQMLDYRIFVVEQADSKLFNRAKLLNVGFTIARKMNNFDCFFFHDLDKLPEDSSHLYLCSKNNPRHMINRMRKVGTKNYINGMHYHNFFGGVTALTEAQILRVNGMANDYWGWGREDDDLSTRIRLRKLSIIYSNSASASYINIGHASDIVENKHPWPYAHMVAKEIGINGLSNLNFTLLAVEHKALYTNISVYL